jgi:hypothetical protein
VVLHENLHTIYRAPGNICKEKNAYSVKRSGLGKTLLRRNSKMNPDRRIERIYVSGHFDPSFVHGCKAQDLHRLYALKVKASRTRS